MRRLARPGWLLCHVVTIALVITFLRLGWWQIGRAEGGNGLSIGYSLEWPAFALFVIIVWAHEVRGALAAQRASRASGTDTAGATADEAPDVTTSTAPGVPAGVAAFDLEAARAARAERTRRGLEQAELNRMAVEREMENVAGRQAAGGRSTQ